MSKQSIKCFFLPRNQVAQALAECARLGGGKVSYPVDFGCCASAVTPRASSTTATRIDDLAALFIAHLVLETITPTIIPKTII